MLDFVLLFVFCFVFLICSKFIMKENIKIVHPFRTLFSGDQCEWLTAQIFNGQMLQSHVLTGMCNKSLFFLLYLHMCGK